MPRIRKKTSNRVKTRDREKIKKKVRDTRKKKTKVAKKSSQWKSKKPKDPGIPNDFPYKDQILAEVQEQRRIAAEGKLRSKEEKQKAHARAKAIARGELVEEDDAEGSQNDVSGGEEENMPVDAEGIASLSAKTINAKLKFQERASLAVVEAEEEEEEEEAPTLFNHDLPNLLAVLEKADVILEVLDARDPLAFRSKQIEDIVVEKGKKILFVLNKIDRCPREAVAAWSERLRTEHPTLLFRSASVFLPEEQTLQNLPTTRKGKSKVPVGDALGAESIISCLSEWAKTKDDVKLTVAVVGLANVGKSSLINSLLKKSSLPVYTVASSSQGPTTTELPQEVTLNTNGATITIVDTPGLSFAHEDEADQSLHGQIRAKDILLRSKGRIDRLKDPLLPIPYIVSRANNEDLMLLYSLPAFAKGDFTAFLSGVARASQLVKRKGDLDLIGAARVVLRDWNSGKFARYCTTPTAPPTTSLNIDSVSTSFLAPLYAKDEAVLAVLATRKEIRKKGGLVKLSPSEVEERKARLEEDWNPTEVDGDESSDDSKGENNDSANMVLDIEEEEEEEFEKEEQEQEGEGKEADEDKDSSPDSESEEEEKATPAVVLQSRKQKRKREVESLAPARPSKRVTLAPIISSSKGKKDRLRSHQNLSEAKAKSKLASAAVPKVVTAPKSILKKTKGGLSEKVATKRPQSQVAGKEGSKKNGDNGAEIYDFGRFF